MITPLPETLSELTAGRSKPAPAHPGLNIIGFPVHCVYTCLHCAAVASSENKECHRKDIRHRVKYERVQTVYSYVGSDRCVYVAGQPFPAGAAEDRNRSWQETRFSCAFARVQSDRRK